jgi:hypothetical protein
VEKLDAVRFWMEADAIVATVAVTDAVETLDGVIGEPLTG